MIEIGVDILNPIQVSAQGMDTKVLKDKFGKEISFWGAIDTTQVLPNGSIDVVKREVQKRIQELGPDGYILAAVHDIQPDVPPENIVTMYTEAKNISISK